MLAGWLGRLYVALILYFQENAVIGEHIWTDADSSGHSCCIPDNECMVCQNSMSVKLKSISQKVSLGMWHNDTHDKSRIVAM